MASKSEFVEEVQEVATTLIEAIESIPKLKTIFEHRGYGDPEGDPILDGDTKVKEALVTQFIDLVKELEKFADGPEGYRAILNKLRTGI